MSEMDTTGQGGYVMRIIRIGVLEEALSTAIAGCSFSGGGGDDIFNLRPLTLDDREVSVARTYNVNGPQCSLANR